MPSATPFFKKLFASTTQLDSLFTRLTPLLLGLLGFLLLLLVILYSVQVSLTGQIQKASAEAKTMHEENLTLEVELNQLRSYNTLNEDVRQLKHLVAAEHKLQLKPQQSDLNQPILQGTTLIKRTPPYSPMAGY